MTLATDVTHKALAVNLDPSKCGTFAEIGAGQEVVRWFFHVGRAAGTVAKSISAYDMAVSDGLYGKTDHYVSRQRLESMLDHEWGELLQRLDGQRGDRSTFFVLADTAATQPFSAGRGGHAWMGVRFQTAPRGEPSQILLHLQMLGLDSVDQQAALGLLGVNLVYGAFFQHDEPAGLLDSLMEGLNRRRIEIDLIRFSGPAFRGVDNRVMSLELVERGLTDTAMFTAAGEVVQAAEILSHKPVIVERGGFRPVTTLTSAMLDLAMRQLVHDDREAAEGAIVLMEMTLHNLMSEQKISHQDFLARADMLGALGRTVMVSNYTRFDKVTDALRRYTPNLIGMVMGVPALRAVFDESYYGDVRGGLLEGLGRLFQGKTRILVHPTVDEAGELVTADTLEVPPAIRFLYRYCLESRALETIRDFDPRGLHVTPRDVLHKIQTGDPTWESEVPPKAASIIKEKGLFSLRHAPAR